MTLTRLTLTSLLLVPLTLTATTTVLAQSNRGEQDGSRARDGSRMAASQAHASVSSTSDAYYDNMSSLNEQANTQRRPTQNQFYNTPDSYYDSAYQVRDQANTIRRPTQDQFFDNSDQFYDNMPDPYNQGRYARDARRYGYDSHAGHDHDYYYDDLSAEENYLENPNRIGYPDYDAPYQGYSGFENPRYGYPTYGYPNFGYPGTRYDNDLDIYSDRWWDW